MKIESKPFVYDTAVVSQKQFDDHITLYNGYVGKTNETTEMLKNNPEWKSANATGGHYRGWKKTETYAINGVFLHELYFQNLGSRKSKPLAKTQKVFTESFGSFENWKDDFIACATSARGWCILVYEQRTKSFRNILLDTHEDGNIVAAFPLIVLDMYEHAYFLDFGTDKTGYINKFIDNISWDLIESRISTLI